jgi:hypothetical protein
MDGTVYLDAAIHTTRLWEGRGIIGTQESRAADGRSVRLLTSYLGEVVQKACEKLGGDLMGAFHQQYGDIFFACIADFRRVFPWPQAAPTVSWINEGLREDFQNGFRAGMPSRSTRSGEHDAAGQLLGGVSIIDQRTVVEQQLPGEVGEYADDASMVVPLNEAAAAAAQYYPADPVQLDRLAGRLARGYSGPQIMARLNRLIEVGPVVLTADDKSRAWALVAKWMEGHAAPYFQLRCQLFDLARTWHIEAKQIWPDVKTSTGRATATHAARPSYQVPPGENRPSPQVESALQALFIGYLRSRSDRIDGYVRRYQPDGNQSQLRTYYGTGLSGSHMLQANPSYVDPDACGGKFAPLADLLSSVGEPSDAAALLICLMSTVSSDTRAAVEALASVHDFRNKSFKMLRAEAGHLQQGLYSKILFAPLRGRDGFLSVRFEDIDEPPDVRRVLYDAVSARVEVVLKELEVGVRQHFYSRQLWEGVTGWLPMLLQQLLRKRYGHLVTVTCESGLSRHWPATVSRVEEDIDFQVTNICSLPVRGVFYGRHHDPVIIPGSFAAVGVQQGDAVPQASYGDAIGTHADLCSGIEGVAVLIALVQMVPKICHEHFLHQMRCVREMEALQRAGHFNNAGQEWLRHYTAQYPHAAGPARNLALNAVQGWEAAAGDVPVPAAMGNPAPEWTGIEGGQWLDWRSVRWVRGVAGFSTQNAVAGVVAVGDSAGTGWEHYSRPAAMDAVTAEMQEDHFASSPFSFTRMLLPAVANTGEADDVD